ncbi:MAG: acetate--CoA ligase family protein [Desulfarculaceae bacterium]|nr:acetate--CoA ligase family protein [Desulfarculaceae bacterium]MCF8071681.1 acetate--CoA ligase family protein [Desulfarculaceae bacterium]MCF8102472.1 acetate--CoA ligase family protein [Desulfarculaceae bacterium]MCF8116814.1 acetate--CoA ligase family protein [Desulfarculaceae bacterium]
MKNYFNPSSVAVVGASPDRTGFHLLENVKLTPGVQAYPVNPKYPELAGLPCYPSVSAIPGPVDMAILLVPARFVPQVLQECGEKGVGAVMIQSAGFAETGEDGRLLQEQCLAIARKNGMRLWGPNCMGLVDVTNNRFFTFMHSHITGALASGGNLSLVVQSGMLSAGFLADLATRRGVAVSMACSLGNKMDVDECDVLQVLLDDPSTQAVALYLESLPRGRLFLELAEMADKPVVVLKTGRSASGAKAAMSHTASLAGNARLTDGLLAAAGVGTARDFHQLVDQGRTLALLPDLPAEARVAVLTFSGGAGILSCDLLEDRGLRLAELTQESLRALAELFPPWMPPSNPVDLWPAMEQHGVSETLERAAAIVAEDPGVDLLFMHSFLGAQSSSHNLKGIQDNLKAKGKALAFWSLGLDEPIKLFQQKAIEAGVPLFGELARAVDCVAAASAWRGKNKPAPRPAPSGRPLPEGLPEPEGVWDEQGSKQLLAAWDIPVVRELVAEDLAQAEQAAKDWGWPLVLKGLMPGEVHKTELGLVELGISGPDELAAAWDRLQKVMQGRGKVLVQPQHKPEYELIVGFLRDPQFGPCVMLGMGGVLAELEADVAFEMAPLDQARALAMLDRLRGAGITKGFRKLPPLDREALAGLICRLGDLGASLPGITQIDINPVAVERGAPLALDASVIWEEPA